MIRRTVTIHPEIDKFIRKIWAELVRKGYNTSYTTVLQLVAIAGIQHPPTEEELKQLLTSKGKLNEKTVTKLLNRGV